MNKSVIILDLDNTIYPVSSIGERLFKSLFATIKNSGEYDGDFEEIKTEIQRTPFQKVAHNFSFSKKLLEECMKIHVNLTFDDRMYTYDDYAEVRKLPQKKYLVTSGFSKLQHSKVKQLKIADDFEEIHILDLQVSSQSKKDIFNEIINRNNFTKDEIIVVGDDLTSEIKAGNELGITSVLYDRENQFDHLKNQKRISHFQHLKDFL